MLNEDLFLPISLDYWSCRCSPPAHDSHADPIHCNCTFRRAVLDRLEVGNRVKLWFRLFACDTGYLNITTIVSKNRRKDPLNCSKKIDTNRGNAGKRVKYSNFCRDEKTTIFFAFHLWRGEYSLSGQREYSGCHGYWSHYHLNLTSSFVEIRFKGPDQTQTSREYTSSFVDLAFLGQTRIY